MDNNKLNTEKLPELGTEKLLMNIILMMPREKLSARLLRVVSKNLYTLFDSELFDISYNSKTPEEYAKIDENYDSTIVYSDQVVKHVMVPMILKLTHKYLHTVNGLEYAPGTIYSNNYVIMEAPSNECFVRVQTKPISPKEYLKQYMMIVVIEYLLKYFALFYEVDIKVLFGSNKSPDVLMDKETIHRQKQMYLDHMVFVKSE